MARKPIHPKKNNVLPNYKRMTLKRGKDKKLMPKLLNPSVNMVWWEVRQKYYSGREYWYSPGNKT